MRAIIKTAVTLVWLGRAGCLRGTALIGELAQKKCCSALEQKWQVETLRWLPAVCRFNAVGRPMASEQPRAALPGTLWHAIASIISSILSQNLLVDQRMNVSKSYVEIKNDDEPSATEALRSFRLHVCTCAFQSYAQLLTQPSLKGESPAASVFNEQWLQCRESQPLRPLRSRRVRGQYRSCTDGLKIAAVSPCGHLQSRRARGQKSFVL